MKRRTKPSERASHKLQWQESGQTKKAYCEEVGIKYATFISWFKPECSKTASGGFISLSVDDWQNYSTEILLPNGIRLRTQAPLTTGLLKNLYDV